MHGAHDSSLTWEWLLPELTKHHHVVAVDRIGDFGRSLPRNGLTSSLPDGEDDTVEWIASVKSELGFDGTPVSFVCHSYGCFVTAMFAMGHPGEVDKVILTAPAAVVAPQQIPDLVYPAVFQLVAGDLSLSADGHHRGTVREAPGRRRTPARKERCASAGRGR
jgi:pimeloyl-ACP methyl ester carboxylesterase